ncbi:MAG: AMP-dependent synthetase/ligase [Desulfuromonadales bacterium]
MSKTSPDIDHEHLPDTLPRMVLSGNDRYRDHPVCRSKYSGEYHDIPWADFVKDLNAHARGLLAAGIKHGDRVAIMAPNGPNWVWADVATQACGGISVPVYHTESLANTLYILNSSSSRFLFVWSAVVAGELLQHLEDLPTLETVILFRGELEHQRLLLQKDFLKEAEPDLDQELSRRLESGKPEDLASIVYTSGTTGPPKGVMLTHRNFLANIRDCAQLFQLGSQDTCLSFLPLSHVFERMAGYYLMLHQGVTIAYAENFDSLPVNLHEVQPTVVFSVPRLYEKMFARVMDKVVSGPWFKRKIFFTSLSLCKVRVARELSGRPVPALLKISTDILRKWVFQGLRNSLGGRIRFLVSGGAPLTRNVAEFFLATGIQIFEGYGLTETSPVIAVNTPQALRLGTVGKPLPGTQVKLAADGEILVAGPGVFQGYWENPEQSRKALQDGWFHTGDIGELDDQGFLSITDRKKDLIVTAGGENVAPQILEKLFKTDKFIANSMVCGDRRPFLTALLIPNFDNLSRYARMKNIDFITHCDLVNHPTILELMRRRIEKLQQDQPSFMRIKRFTLLSRDFLVESGELTQTLKIKRKAVSKKFKQVIESMYQPQDHGAHDHGFCIIDKTEEDS